MRFLQIGEWIHHYKVEGAKEKPALLFANSLGSDLRIIFCVEQPVARAERMMRFFREVQIV
jgi:hypothetical protein